MTKYKIISIDLAKTKFHVGALDMKGALVLKKAVLRDDLLDYMISTFPKNSLIAMEACGGCHYWGQKFQEKGFQIKLLKPKDVKPYAKSKQKNDINDALAIAKAALDPELKEVHLKNVFEQSVSFLHKTRKIVIKQRVQKSNGVLTSLMEFGFVPKASKAAFAKEISTYIKEAYDKGYIPEEVYLLLRRDGLEIQYLLKKETLLKAKITALNRESEIALRLQEIPGIGHINASILSIQPMKTYDTPRDFSASLGLVPSQHTTGGTVHLGRITKQGNRYMRTMLIQGARTIIMRGCRINPPKDPIYAFAQKLYAKKGFNMAAVAVANKLARIAHAMVTQDRYYKC